MAMPGPTPPGEVLTFGVEEEFLLADVCSRATVARAAAVIADAAQELGERVKTEFFATQVEVCTPPVASTTALRDALVRARLAVASAAGRANCLLVPSGSAVLPSRHPLPVTDSARYRRIAQHVGDVADDRGGEICGCHVHLGTLSRAEAIALSNHLRPWLPVLQAITVNSPYREGHDSGFASWRAIQYRRWPTVGPAPVLDEEAYERVADHLVSSGVLLDRRMIYWYARPSEHVPTLEVRIADVNADPDTTVLLAVLLRALGTALLTEVRDGHPPPALSTDRLIAAHRQAARHGMHGSGVDPATGARQPMTRLLQRLVDRITPSLEATGDLLTARALLAGLRARGTGADRQRAAYERRGSLSDVVDDIATVATAV